MKILPVTFAALFGTAALADVPKVVTDIAPVQSIVARVMQGLGTPDVIVRPGVSPHGYAMRPSEAAALEAADLIVWVGEGLTPWMEEAIDTLAKDSHEIELLDLEETALLDMREGVNFEPHDHGDDDHDDHHGEDDHDHDGEHAHDEDHAGEHEEHDHHGHAHGTHDPHAWLDPENAAAWMQVIAGELAEIDPGNASAYMKNAEDGRAELAALTARLQADLQPARGNGFLVFHDAYQYFEHRFDVPVQAAVSLGDASDPGPARLAELQAIVKENEITCAFSEPQFNPRVLQVIFDGAVEIAVLDPLGAGLEPGITLYPALLESMAKTMLGCGA